MAALRPEALNEGDVARLTSVGVWNKALARIGLPPQMTVEQLDTLSKMINDKAREAEPRRRALIKDARKRAKYFGFPPDLILGEYADGIPRNPRPVPADASSNSDASASDSGSPPPGAKPDPVVPGLWILPDGSGWEP